MAGEIFSPGVTVNEIDLSAIPNQIDDSTVGVIAGYAQRGPINTVVALRSRKEVINTYGKPQNEAERYFINSCIQYIEEAGSLLAVRLPYGVPEDFKYSGIKATFVEDTLQGTVELSSITTGSLEEAELKSLVGGDYSALVGTDLELSSDSFVIANLSINNHPKGDGDVYVAIMDYHTSLNTNIRKTWLEETFPFDNGSAIYGQYGNDKMVDVALNGANGMSTRIWDSVNQQFDADSLLIVVYQYILDPSGENDKGQMIVLETFLGSLDPSKKDSAGNSLYIEDVINPVSNNIRIYAGRSSVADDITDWVQQHRNIVVQDNATYGVASGDGNKLYNMNHYKVDPATLTIGNTLTKLQSALSMMSNPEEIPVDVIMDAGLSTIYAARDYYGSSFEKDRLYEYDRNDVLNLFDINRYQDIVEELNNFAKEVRKDCVAIIDPPRHFLVSGQSGIGQLDADNQDQMFTGDSPGDTEALYNRVKANMADLIDSSYCASYINWGRVRDQYNGVSYWHPYSSIVGSVYARTDFISDPWQAPAGFARATTNNVEQLAVNLDKPKVGLLYRIGLNSVVNFPGEGIVIWGQKTMQKRKSAFDRVNVRRLFLALEKSSARVAKYFAFQPNNLTYRTRLVNALRPLFDYAKARDGIENYRIICDETNNPPSVRERNEMVVDIIIDATRTGEFIVLNFIATRSGVNLSEVTGIR